MGRARPGLTGKTPWAATVWSFLDSGTPRRNRFPPSRAGVAGARRPKMLLCPCLRDVAPGHNPLPRKTPETTAIGPTGDSGRTDPCMLTRGKGNVISHRTAAANEGHGRLSETDLAAFLVFGICRITANNLWLRAGLFGRRSGAGGVNRLFEKGDHRRWGDEEAICVRVVEHPAAGARPTSASRLLPGGDPKRGAYPTRASGGRKKIGGPALTKRVLVTPVSRRGGYPMCPTISDNFACGLVSATGPVRKVFGREYAFAFGWFYRAALRARFHLGRAKPGSGETVGRS